MANSTTRRARPLTFVQEVFLITTALVVGGVLEMLVIFHIGAS